MGTDAVYLKESVEICMSCALPDCDITHSLCLLREAWNERRRLMRENRPVPFSMHAAAMEYGRQEKIERLARDSEGGR